MSHADDDLMPVGGNRPTPPPAPQPAPTDENANRPPASQMPPLGGPRPAPPAGPTPNPASVPGLGTRTPAGAPGPITLSPGTSAPGAPTGPSTPPPGSPVRCPLPVEEEATGISLVWKIVGAVVAVTVALIAYFVFRTPPPVDPPSGFGVFTAKDNSFTCARPNGWDMEAHGGAAGKTADIYGTSLNFESGNARIEITFSTVAGLVGSQLLFGNEVVPSGISGSRAETIHRLGNTALKKRFKGYKSKDTGEHPGSMGAVFLNEGKYVVDSRLSEWTATGNKWGLGGKMHGYRASMSGRDLIAGVVCYCSERDWPKLKPAFMEVISSIQEVRKPDPRGLGFGDGAVPGGVPAVPPGTVPGM